MFSKFFIERPIFATVLALLIIVAGLVTLRMLPIEQYPNITPPTVQVNAVYPGANAETVAQTVGIPIEQQVNGVEGMMYMSSTSSASGAYSLTVTFEVGTDIDMATVMVQNRVSVALNSLPEAVKQQGVTVQKKSSNIVMMLTLGGDSIYDGLYLANYANLNLVDQLTRVPGVGAVNVMGAGDYSMRIWLDPEAMRIRNLSADQVYAAIQAQNMEVSAGNVGQPFGRSGNNAFQYTLNVKGRLTTPDEFGEIILRVEDGGRILRLKDVARIELGSQKYNVVSRLEGKPTAGIAVYQLPGSNSLDVAKGVKARMEELAEAFPKGIHYAITLDTTEVVHDSINEVMKTFIEATILVVLVMFFFLQSWRAVLIPCITIPVSLIGTLAVMAALGFSINTLTLFGLVLAIAIVVDDAIVVVENVTRLLDEAEAKGEKIDMRKITEVAMGEITGPIIGVMLVLLAVFLPTTLIGGIQGQLYKQFALTIAASTVLSGLNSLTLSPALCAILLKPTPKQKSRVFLWFDRFNDWMQRTFNRSVKWLLARPVVAMSTFVVLSAIALLLFVKWPTTFMPEEDDGYFIVSVQLPAASSLERTEAVGKQIDAILKQYPEIKTFLGVNGFSVMGGGELPNAATYFVVLKNWNERPGKEHSAQAVVDRFNRQAYGMVQEAQVFGIIPPVIPGMGNTGGLQFELEDRKSLGAEELQKAVNTLLAEYRSEPNIASLSSMYQADVPQYYLNINRDKVQLLDLNLNQVFAALSYYLGQAYVNDFVEFGRIYQVKLGAGEDAQKYIDDVLKLSVENSRGEMVPFNTFMQVEQVLGMDQVSRYNMYQSASITANVAPGSSSGETIEAVGSLVRNQLGNEFGYEWTSVAYQETKASGSTALVLVMALLVAYLVLAAQYESWTSPVAAVMGLPIAILGAMLGCWIMGEPVSIYTEIGIVLLIALSAKNGILIVEFARDYRKAGNSIREAAFEAGSVRLRPILMTSFTFVLGVMPLLFATGAGAGSRVALGAAVVFGMLVNTVVATLYIPNWYEVMQTIEERWFSKRK
ncbi:MAG: multidrug efflux RND transporter permease subunit [Bacteroidaceae bacterium]|nr:multidrug efflux RND transporter permease subunit [Bacteroidaceae bacterium]